MNKLFKTLRRKDVGSIGIGAMIVFIAMVLVAGIAASVLIQTSNRLEMQAMKTGQDTIEEVSTGIAVFDIEGKRGTDLRDIAIVVRPRAGSSEIDLNETVILISDGTTKALLTYYGWNDANLYNSSVNASGQLFAPITAAPWTAGTLAWANLTNDYFGIIVLNDPDGSCTQTNPVINNGDKVALCINASVGLLFNREIPERTEIYGRVIPEFGSPGIISFTTPSTYPDIIYDLQ
jgi:flagellin FlaB